MMDILFGIGSCIWDKNTQVLKKIKARHFPPKELVNGPGDDVVF